jgi:hypothetical protein
MGSKNKKEHNSKKVEGNKAGGGDQEIDSRFARVKYDAAFQKMDKTVNKTKVDDRFKDMFDKKRFGAGSTKVDKYGRNKDEEVD